MFLVGIGASAGGLQALTEFFKNVPENSGAAYFVITHLLREHKSQLNKIIQRQTKIPVSIMRDNGPIQENNIYVLPENKVATTRNGFLKLGERPQNEKENKVIDLFLSSLAEERGSQVIGVILSGTGTDGLQGAKRIEEKGGIVIAQDPMTAQFNGMPLTTISLDSPRYILSPKDMPGTIIEHILERSQNFSFRKR